MPDPQPFDLGGLIARVETGVSGDPLERLAGAMEMAQQIAATGDLLVDHFVQAARAAGHSWTEVGGVLGVSKQAAQKRYVHGRAKSVRIFGGSTQQQIELAEFTLGEPGLKRFTRDARRAVVRAKEIAQELGHSKLGTEHLLLGVLSDATWPSAQVIEKAGLTPAAVQRKVERGIGVGSVPIPADTPVPFTPRAKTVLSLAMTEALQLQHNYIEPHHVLLAIIREGEGWGARVLDELGLDLVLLRKNLVLALADRQRAFSAEPPSPGAGEGAEGGPTQSR